MGEGLCWLKQYSFVILAQVVFRANSARSVLPSDCLSLTLIHA